MSGRLVRDDVNGKGHLRVSRQERTVLRPPWCRNVVVTMVPQCSSGSQLAVLDVCSTVSATSGCPARSAGCGSVLCVFYVAATAKGVTHELLPSTLPIPPLSSRIVEKKTGGAKNKN